jgi:cold shock CspA family protein
MNAELESRERGTIVSIGTYRLGGFGHIRADNGDTVAMFYWSLISGFHTLRIGQRVEFSRARYGFNQNVATLVEPVIRDADFNDHEGR